MYTCTHKCPTYTKLEEKTVFGDALAPVEVTNNGAYVHASMYVHMYLYAHRHYHRLHHHDHYYCDHYHMHRQFSISYYPSLSLTTRFYAFLGRRRRSKSPEAARSSRSRGRSRRQDLVSMAELRCAFTCWSCTPHTHIHTHKYAHTCRYTHTHILKYTHTHIRLDNCSYKSMLTYMNVKTFAVSPSPEIQSVKHSSYLFLVCNVYVCMCIDASFLHPHHYRNHHCQFIFSSPAPSTVFSESWNEFPGMVNVCELRK